MGDVMADEIPQWAKERASALSGHAEIECCAFTTLARYISEHEEPPFGDEVRAIFAVEAEKLQSGEGASRARTVARGNLEYWEARVAMACLKRGMELAGERS